MTVCGARREGNLKLTMRTPKCKSQEEEDKHVWSGECKKEDQTVVRQEDKGRKCFKKERVVVENEHYDYP